MKALICILLFFGCSPIDPEIPISHFLENKPQFSQGECNGWEADQIVISVSTDQWSDQESFPREILPYRLHAAYPGSDCSEPLLAWQPFEVSWFLSEGSHLALSFDPCGEAQYEVIISDRLWIRSLEHVASFSPPIEVFQGSIHVEFIPWCSGAEP